MSEVRAVVFDCDGLLVDTERAFEAAYSACLARRGHRVEPELRQLLLGASLAEAAQALALDLGLDADEHGSFESELEATILDILPTMGRALPGARALLGRLSRLPKTVASNSSRAHVTKALAAAGLAQFFDLICCLEDDLRPKPFPDLYSRACSVLEVRPDQTIAFEDSPRGVEAARRAGLFVVGVASLPGTTLEADLNVSRLDDARVLTLLGLGR